VAARLCFSAGSRRRSAWQVSDFIKAAGVPTSRRLTGEHAILERLSRATPHPTIFMIAHRLESLRHCQRILLFEGGRFLSGQEW
jgi:hypothetical protein